MSHRIRYLFAVALAAAAGSLAAAPADAAVEALMTCDAFLVEPDGSLGNEVGSDISNPLDVRSWTGPATVEPHSALAFADEGGTWSLPTDGEGPSGPVTFQEYKNIVFDYQIFGAASVDSATLAGGDVIGATATVVAPDHVEVELPGTQAGSASPGGTHFVPPPFTFTPPVVTVGVTAGEGGSTVTARLARLEFTQAIDTDSGFVLRIVCTSDTTLATTAVVATAPPDTPPAPAEPALPRTGVAPTSTALALAGLAAIASGSMLAVAGVRRLPHGVRRRR